MNARRFSTGVAAAALCMWLSPAFAGQAKPAPPEAGQPKTGQAAASPDKAFVLEAASGGMAEVELGRLAVDKASSSDVKQFGQRMVDDHSKANNDLSAVAQQKNIAMPTSTSAKHKALHDRLSKLSGAEFDKAYMADMVKDHQKDVADFQHEAKMGKDADVKAFASRTLPVLEDHLRMAHDAAVKVGATTATTTKTTTAKKK